MSFSAERMWLIAYDVANPRRLQRVHRLLKQYAMDVQYSVFAGQLSERQLAVVMYYLEREINATADDVRIYPVPYPALALTLGRRPFPRGILLADARALSVVWPAGASNLTATGALKPGTGPD